MSNNKIEYLTSNLNSISDESFKALVLGFLQRINKKQADLGKKMEILTSTDFLSYLEQTENLDNFIEYYQSNLENKSRQEMVDIRDKAETNSSDDINQESPIHFINRLDEIKMITYSSAPAYYLLDGPEGFGKSVLMRELNRIFQKNNWVCVYVTVNEGDSLDNLISAIRTNLGVNSQSPSTASLAPSLRLASAMRSHWINEVNEKKGRTADKEGMVLLVDLDKRPSQQVVEGLLKELIPAIAEGLRELEIFKNRQNRFRVVMAGRRLASISQQIHKQFIPVPRQLAPFDYDVIRISVSDKLAKRTIFDENVINKLAAKLLFLTGGHPGAMAQVLEMYDIENIEVDAFFKNYEEIIWRDITRPIIEKIRDEIFKASANLRGLIDEICVYRSLDSYIFRHIIKKSKAKGIDEVKLANELTQNFILTFKDRAYRDDITRRLLAIWQWHNSRDMFFESCAEAENLCKLRLEDASANSKSERWAIESLFQALQQKASTVESSQHRDNIRDVFINDTLPQVLRSLVKDRDPNDEHNALVQAMDEDWEFQFTVNYYLREDEYTTHPYEKIKESINSFFNKI